MMPNDLKCRDVLNRYLLWICAFHAWHARQRVRPIVVNEPACEINSALPFEKGNRFLQRLRTSCVSALHIFLCVCSTRSYSSSVAWDPNMPGIKMLVSRELASYDAPQKWAVSRRLVIWVGAQLKTRRLSCTARNWPTLWKTRLLVHARKRLKLRCILPYLQ